MITTVFSFRNGSRLRSRLNWFACCLILCGCLSGCRTALAETVAQVKKPAIGKGIWVSDMAQILDASTEKQLNALITNLERRTTAEIAVVTIRSATGFPPKSFATKLFNHWGIGKKSSNNGVLILMVTDARYIRIETGRGMDKVLPDAKMKSLLGERVIPRFKQKDYNGGILTAAHAVIKLIKQGPLQIRGPAAVAAPQG